jgi:hypothetical protein
VTRHLRENRPFLPRHKEWGFLAALALLAVIPGCSLTDTLAVGRVQGNEESVAVKADSAVYAAPLALGHCSHYGRGAQFDHELEPGRYLYRCVQSN